MRYLWVGLLATTICLPAHATTVSYLSESDMVQKAAVIARGHVTLAFSYDHPSGFIVTEVQIKIDRQLKGAPMATLTLTQLGGTIGERTLRVPGSHAYIPGEEVLVFASDTANGLVEMAVGAGKYQITREGGRARIKRQNSGLAVVHPKEPTKVSTLPPAQEEDLATFENRILSLLGKEAR